MSVTLNTYPLTVISGGVCTLWVKLKCQCTGSSGRALLCRESQESHTMKLVVIALRQADAPLLTSTQRNCTLSEYLVLMPSPIFEFWRGVHGSPSVIYHPTENLRICSACLFQVPGKRKTCSSLFWVSTCDLDYSIEKTVYFFNVKNIYAAQPPHELRTEIPPGVSCLSALYSNKSKTKYIDGLQCL